MHKTKIQKLRWHKQKFLIRCIAWLTILSFLIVLLLLGFPIVSDASSLKISDEFYIKDILNSEDALTYYGSDSFYTTILNNESYSPFFAAKDLAYQYYQPLKDLFDSNFDSNNLSNYQLFVFFNKNDTDNLYYIVHDKNLLYGTRYSSGEKRISFDSSYVYKFNISDKTITGVSGWTGSLDNLTNDWYCLFSSVQIKYEVIGVGNRHDFNYLLSQDLQGKGQGGFDISDSSKESIKNHEKVYNGSTMYLQTSNLNDGSLHIVVKSDDVQKKNGKVILRCNVVSTVKHNSIYNYRLSASNGFFSDNYNTPDNTFNRGTYSEYEIPLSDFSSSGDYSIPLKTLNEGLWTSYEKTLEDFNQNFQDKSTYAKKTITATVFYLLTIGNATWDYSQLDDFDYALLSEVYDCQAVFKIGDSETPIKGFQYDIVNNSLTEQDYDLPDEDSIKDALDSTIVPNDYVPTPQKPSYPDAYNITVPNNNTDIDSDNSSNSNNNVTVSGGDNSVINNVTVTQNDKYPQKGVMTSFLKIINQDKNDAVKYIGDTSGINGYLHLMQVSMSWIPQEVWSVWISYLKAILGICVGAFFLKILVNWST